MRVSQVPLRSSSSGIISSSLEAKMRAKQIFSERIWVSPRAENISSAKEQSGCVQNVVSKGLMSRLQHVSIEKLDTRERNTLDHLFHRLRSQCPCLDLFTSSREKNNIMGKKVVEAVSKQLKKVNIWEWNLSFRRNSAAQQLCVFETKLKMLPQLLVNFSSPETVCYENEIKGASD